MKNSLSTFQLFILILLSCLSFQAIWAVDNLGLFELDGNIVSSGVDDAADVANGFSASPITTFGIDDDATDGVDTSKFTGGGS